MVGTAAASSTGCGSTACDGSTCWRRPAGGAAPPGWWRCSGRACPWASCWRRRATASGTPPSPAPAPSSRSASCGWKWASPGPAWRSAFGPGAGTRDRWPSYGGAVLLALGSTTVDVADRALVLAVLRPAPPTVVAEAAERAAAQGADLVEVQGHERPPSVRVPVAVRTPDAMAASAALGAGAVLAVDPSGFADPGYLPAVRDAGASVVAALPVGTDAGEVVAALRAVVTRAVAAGLEPGHLALEPVAPAGTAVALPRAPGLRCAGAPVLVSVVRAAADAGHDPGSVAGPLAVAVVRGCGLVRVAAADVRSARRVVDVIGAVRR